IAFAARIALLVALTVFVVALVFEAPRPVAAAVAGAPIDLRLQQQMLVNPLKSNPVIVEMEHISSPLGAANLQLAQQAFNLLQLNGQAQVALPLLGSAAGLANAAGITALSLAPGVAYVHFDTPVRAHDGNISTANLATAYPRAVNADRVWALGRSGQGVTVAVLDSGISPDADLAHPPTGFLPPANFANCKRPCDVSR